MQTHRQATGVDRSAIYQHEPPTDLAGARPPATLLSKATNEALAEYTHAAKAIKVENVRRLELNGQVAERAALEADERLAAEQPPGAEVGTPNLDRLFEDRRRVMVSMGGAARRAENRVNVVRAARRGPDALSTEAGAAAAKARATALKLCDQIRPLLETVTNWDAAVVWTQENLPYRPDRGPLDALDRIATHLFEEGDRNA